MAADLFGQPDPPQGRSAPLPPRGDAFRAVIRETFAHIVQKEVAVGPDELEGVFRLLGVAGGHELRPVAAGTAGLVEQALPLQHLRRADLAPPRHGEVSGVEHHQVEHLARNLQSLRRIAPVGRFPAPGLSLRAIAPCLRGELRRESDIPGKGARRLLDHRGRTRLPTEATERPGAARGAHDEACASRDAVPVRVVGVREREDVGLGNRLDQSHPDHRRRHPGREHEFPVQGSVARIEHLVPRVPEPDGVPSRERDTALLPGDPDPAFGRYSLNRVGLKLRAVDRLRDEPNPPLGKTPLFLVVARRDRERQQHRDRPLAGAGRPAPAVLDVATLAGPGVVQGAQTVRGRGGGGRRHPELAENAVADVEIELSFESHVGGRMREGVRVRRRQRGRGAAGVSFEGLGGTEVARGPSDLGHPKRVGGIARRDRRPGGDGEASRKAREQREGTHFTLSLDPGPRPHPPQPSPGRRARAGTPPPPRGRSSAPASLRSVSWFGDDYSNTFSGSSRLSEPSTSIAARPKAATTCSMVRVCSVSRSIAACTTALPAGFSAPSIWS